MTIDNSLEAAKIRIIYIILLFLIGAGLLFSVFEGFRNILHYTAFSVSAVLFVVYLIMHLRGLYFIYFNDDKRKIVLRYFYVHALFRKYKAIEIPKSKFASYTIENKFLGLRKELVFYVQTKGTISKFPAVSVSALTKKQLKLLFTALNKYVTTTQPESAIEKDKF